MKIRKDTRLALVPRVSGVGGMVSFQHKFAAGLEKRGIAVSYDLRDEPYDGVLVIGGTRDLPGLWRARRKGIPIVQRLNGMNWLHRKTPTGLRHYLRAEYGNWLLNFIRRNLASSIIYQSKFVQGWWAERYGQANVHHRVVYNGVDLDIYSPDGPHERPQDRYRLLLVEGSLMGGYEMGLGTAVGLAEGLKDKVDKPIELMVVGRVAGAVKARWDAQANTPIVWAGQVAQDDIPAIDRSAHLLYSSDINAACPNSVVEALACGLPVAAFATGGVPELVQKNAGRVVDYGGNPWQLDTPNVPALVDAAAEIMLNNQPFREAARRRAEYEFDLEKMVTFYLRAFQDLGVRV
ncbi:MAG: glycosyltransferase [Chloroflexi bacterium]|nr:MAG: glycosyltransferase [Chloroflexota bacterium]MBL1194501.1 glycosyltransferase [Chloroflexota bacterium]NOH11789.1 glycosyltransferase family 4 protein [Chloroflexota bacterium]